MARKKWKKRKVAVENFTQGFGRREKAVSWDLD
jgi:hypothetical protein